MTNQPASVTAANGAGVSNETPAPGGVAATTPAPAAADAQPGIDWKARYEAMEKDLNRLKGSLQSQMAAQQHNFNQTLAQYQRRLEEAETRGLSEDDRRKYEEQRRQRLMQQQAEQNAALQRQLEEQQLRLQYIQQYEEAGIPRSALTLNGSLDDLVNSGWQAVTQLARAARSGTAAPAAGQPAPAAAPTVQPPAVVTQTGAVASAPTMEALMTRYKVTDPEEIFRMFETGQIPADQMPID